MKESVVSFINRVSGDYDRIRVEASDMLPIKGYKNEVIEKINSKSDDLFIDNFTIENDQTVVIHASFQGI